MNLDNISTQAYIDVFNAIESNALNRLSNSPELAPGSDATKIQVSGFSFMLAGTTYNKAAADDIAAPGFSTGAGEFRKVKVCIDAAGAISTVSGDVAAAQADAIAPATPTDKLAIGMLELAASFTSGTTNVTAGMCKAITTSIDVVWS